MSDLKARLALKKSLQSLKNLMSEIPCSYEIIVSDVATPRLNSVDFSRKKNLEAEAVINHNDAHLATKYISEQFPTKEASFFLRLCSSDIGVYGWIKIRCNLDQLLRVLFSRLENCDFQIAEEKGETNLAVFEEEYTYEIYNVT